MSNPHPSDVFHRFCILLCLSVVVVVAAVFTFKCHHSGLSVQYLLHLSVRDPKLPCDRIPFCYIVWCPVNAGPCSRPHTSPTRLAPFACLATQDEEGVHEGARRLLVISRCSMYQPQQAGCQSIALKVYSVFCYTPMCGLDYSSWFGRVTKSQPI